jgi:lactoylglutathione lyase
MNRRSTLTSSSLNLIVIRSSDIERAVALYSQLGIAFTRQRHGNGPEHYSSQIGEIVFEIYPFTSNAGASTGARLGFVVTALDQVIMNLSRMGVKIVTHPKKSELGLKAIIEDFDGHKIEISEPVE